MSSPFVPLLFASSNLPLNLTPLDESEISLELVVINGFIPFLLLSPIYAGSAPLVLATSSTAFRSLFLSSSPTFAFCSSVKLSYLNLSSITASY
ncbi:hypothetical protein D3C76_583910 [compost metagenome]